MISDNDTINYRTAIRTLEPLDDMRAIFCSGEVLNRKDYETFLKANKIGKNLTTDKDITDIFDYKK
ncbi:MAG: hypothetical protein ACP5N1_06300 [Candidatus Woesearchaeota archaeon]